MGSTNRCLPEPEVVAASSDDSQVWVCSGGSIDPYGPQGMNVARIAALRAGLPVTVAGTTVNRFCSSGLQSVAMAAHEIVHEGADIVLAGGVESITAMTQLKEDMKTVVNPWVWKHNRGVYMVMGETAEYGM